MTLELRNGLFELLESLGQRLDDRIAPGNLPSQLSDVLLVLHWRARIAPVALPI